MHPVGATWRRSGMVLVRWNTARPCIAWRRGRLAREPHPGWKRRRLGGRSPVPLSRPRAAPRLEAQASRRSISRPPVSPACRAPPGGAGVSAVDLPSPCLARVPRTAWERGWLARVPRTAWGRGRLAGRSPRPLSRPRAAHRLGGWASRRSLSPTPVSPARRAPPGRVGVSPASRTPAGSAGVSAVDLPSPCLARAPHTAWGRGCLARVPLCGPSQERGHRALGCPANKSAFARLPWG